MAYYLSDEESLDREGIAQVQRRKLAALWRAIQDANPFYRAKLGGVAFAPATDAISRLPFTTRAEIERDQQATPPYGTNLTFSLDRYCRVHHTSGSKGAPMRWLDTPDSWEWFKKCWAVIYRAAGVMPEDRLAYPFSFGPFIGFWCAFESAATFGNFVLPLAALTTSARLQALFDHRITVVCCTPTYALRMAEVSAATGVDLAASSIRALIVAGEPGGSIPATRARLEQAFGARVFDHVGMTEIGPWGFECEAAPGQVHIIETEFIAEVVDPATGAPVANGETGELVLTNLGRVGSPLIRYRTGDQVRLMCERCLCGRWFARAVGGVFGRLDEMIIIRGNNVFPSAIEDAVRAFEEVAEFRMIWNRRHALGELRLEIEPMVGADAASLVGRLTDAIRDRFHFRPVVAIVEPGSLPRAEMKSKRLVRIESDAVGNSS